MHELGITQAVVDAVVDRAAGAPVRVLRLQIGKLSGVEPDSVRFCFEVVAAGTVVEGAELEIAEPAGLARCRSCGTEFELDQPLALCACGSADVVVRGGTELVITSMEVA